MGKQGQKLDSVAAVLQAVGADDVAALRADPGACKRVVDMATGSISTGGMRELLAVVPELSAMFNTLLRSQVEMALSGDAVKQERWRTAQQALAQGRLDAEGQLRLFEMLTQADAADGQRQERMADTFLWSFLALFAGCATLVVAAYAVNRQPAPERAG